MTRAIQHLTRCPACQHTFSLIEQQLELKSGYARCGNCQTIFSAIDNLVAPLQTSLTPLSNSALTSPNAQIDKSATDEPPLLFDDHAGLDETGNLVRLVRVAAPDKKQQVAKSRHPRIASAHQAKSELTDFEIIENFDTVISAKPGEFFQPPASEKEADDEAWLTQLLEEDNKKYDQSQIADTKLTTINRQSHDVTAMLEELGIETNYETPPTTNEYQQKLEERLASQVASQKREPTHSLGMTLVWLIGSLLLALSLWVQYTLFNVNDLVKDPQKANQIQRLCAVVGCHPPLAKPELIDVNTLTLNAAKTNAKQSDLVFALKNTAQQPVLLPNLTFTLRSGNQTHAQFVLTPEQYADKSSTMILAGQIIAVKLRIDYPKNKFEQVNIDVFY